MRSRKTNFFFLVVVIDSLFELIEIESEQKKAFGIYGILIQFLRKMAKFILL